MRPSDYIDLSLSNLWKRKLRTSLTVFGVTIGIGALVSMFAFGKGMQKNITRAFQEMELFNYISVFSGSSGLPGFPHPKKEPRSDAGEAPEAVLDEGALRAFGDFSGVEAVLPDIRFPAAVRWQDREEFCMIQVLPAEFADSSLVRLREGRSYTTDEEDALIISDSLLRRLGIEDMAPMVGRTIDISTLSLDIEGFNPLNLASLIQGGKLPFTRESDSFTILGIAERMGFGGATPLRSDIFLPPGTSERMKKLPITNIWDLLRSPDGAGGYPLVSVRVRSPGDLEAVQSRIEAMGFQTFALADEMEEIKTGFMFMDMFLAAIGMIAIVVASLGIVNTMVMSILERYNEIGIMKAVGAGDNHIRRIFFFESSAIGLIGGILGLGLGWAVSRLINVIVNAFLARQGVPFIQYFTFPFWLCLGAVFFSVLVSLLAGIYPAVRAARVDPVIALRHD